MFDSYGIIMDARHNKECLEKIILTFTGFPGINPVESSFMFELCATFQSRFPVKYKSDA